MIDLVTILEEHLYPQYRRHDSRNDGGIHWKEPVKVVSDQHVHIVGLLGQPVLDGVTLKSGDRVLLTGQEDPRENGIWEIYKTSFWRRPPDFRRGYQAVNSAVVVQEGSHVDTIWMCTNESGVDEISRHGLTFVKFVGAQA